MHTVAELSKVGADFLSPRVAGLHTCSQYGGHIVSRPQRTEHASPIKLDHSIGKNGTSSVRLEQP